MAFQQPRFWKTLERHPLGAAYEDLTEPVAQKMVDGVKEFGIIDGRKIILDDHDGKQKVLDGWQLLQACIKANVCPVFAGLPRGITADQYVGLKNDTRRHETAKKAFERIEARRERIAAALAQGKSTREIAKEEGVSQTVAVRDANLVARRAAAKNKEGGDAVVTEHKDSPKTKEVPLCDRCKRTGPVVNCPRCRELAANQRARKKGSNGKPAYDDKRLIDKFIAPLIRELSRRYELMGNVDKYNACKNHLGKVLEELKEWQAS